CKGVEWEIIEAGSEKTTDSSDYVRSLFSINNKGKVTVNKYAVDGMYVKVGCKSKVNSAIEGTVTVKVQTQKVSAVKFKKSTNQFVGSGKHNIDFTTTYVKNYSGIPEYSAYSSDDEIVTVNGIKNGYLIIDAHKYGQATITLFADNTKKATCKVIIYPDAKGDIAAQKTNYYLQTYQNAPNDSVKLSFINSKTKKEINPSLLKYTLTYADPKYSLAYIDDKGYVHANPANNEEITDKNCDITVTAELKDDPLKRKATTKVTFCTVKQIDRFDVMFYDNAKDMEDENYGIYITDNDEKASIKYDGESQTIGLRIIPYDAKSAVMLNTELDVAITDTNVAEVEKGKDGKPKLITDRNGKIKSVKVKIKIKKAGCFGVTVTSKDKKGVSRTVLISSKTDAPMLYSKNLGKINKNASFELIEKNGTTYKCITTDKKIKIYPADNTEIMEVDIPSSIKLKSTDGSSYSISNEKVFVKEGANNEYSLCLKTVNKNGDSNLKSIPNGDYEVTLRVTCKRFKDEDSENENSTVFTSDIKATFKITNDVPQIENIKAALNPFIKGEMAKLSIKTSEKITSVKIEEGMAMYKKFDVVKNTKDGCWYIKIKENDGIFENYNDKAISGNLLISLKGYQEPVRIKCNLSTKAVKPQIKQKFVPGVQLLKGSEAYTTLIDENKKELTDFKVVRKENGKTPIFDVEAQNDNRVKIVYKNANMSRQGATYSEKVLVTRDNWKAPIEIKMSVKTYNSYTNSQISFEKTTLNINTAINENSASTAVISSISNIELKEGNWNILDSNAARLFDANYKDGIITVSVKPEYKDEIKKKKTYNLVMSNVFTSDSSAKTKALKICVNPSEPAVTLKTSGSIDVINSNTYINVNVSVANVNSTVSKIKLGEGLENFKYQRVDNSTIKIKSKPYAEIKTINTTGYIEIIMSNGALIKKQIKFTPKQSVPTLTELSSQTIDKSTSMQTVDFDFNGGLANGIVISKIDGVDIPNGFNLQSNNGHLFVTLGNKAMKPGEYKIPVKVYFRGAQSVENNKYGTPVESVVTVVVK
ncbi:MAG: hypothetical protein II193_01905, partial [Lachnospiraceae bacterium]|nr:hypothetical protein [Lachnospiraceae bacterium]